MGAAVKAAFEPGLTAAEGRVFVSIHVANHGSRPVPNVRASAFLDGRRVAGSGAKVGPATLEPGQAVSLRLRLPRPSVADLADGELSVRGTLSARVNFGRNGSVEVAWLERGEPPAQVPKTRSRRVTGRALTATVLGKLLSSGQ
jgi:hypothetical protein